MRNACFLRYSSSVLNTDLAMSPRTVVEPDRLLSSSAFKAESYSANLDLLASMLRLTAEASTEAFVDSSPIFFSNSSLTCFNRVICVLKAALTESIPLMVSGVLELNRT